LHHSPLCVRLPGREIATTLPHDPGYATCPRWRERKDDAEYLETCRKKRNIVE
jgi:hypothetical protein